MNVQHTTRAMLNFLQTGQNSPNNANKCATGNALATLTHIKVAARSDLFMKSLLHICKLLINPNFNLKTNYISRKLMNRRFQ